MIFHAGIKKRNISVFPTYSRKTLQTHGNMRCTVFLLYYIQKKRSVRKIKHGKISSVPEQKKGGNFMRISKQTKKTTLAQQGRYLLICLLSMLLLFLAGSVLILNRTQYNGSVVKTKI